MQARLCGHREFHFTPEFRERSVRAGIGRIGNGIRSDARLAGLTATAEQAAIHDVCRGQEEGEEGRRFGERSEKRYPATV